MELRGSSDDTGGVLMATTLQVVVLVEETSQASDIVDSESEISTAATQQKDSMEKTALAVAATAAVNLTNLFFLLHDDTNTGTDNERRRRRWGWGWSWTGGIPVLFAFAALLSAAGLVLVLHTTVVVSAALRRVLLAASAAALFVASAGTVLSLLDAHAHGVAR